MWRMSVVPLNCDRQQLLLQSLKLVFKRKLYYRSEIIPIIYNNTETIALHDKNGMFYGTVTEKLVSGSHW